MTYKISETARLALLYSGELDSFEKQLREVHWRNLGKEVLEELLSPKALRDTVPLQQPKKVR